MKKSFITITILAILSSFTQGCALFSESSLHEEVQLENRIHAVYKAYKNRDFETLLSYAFNQENKKERISELQENLPILIHYRIRCLEIKNEEARVKMYLIIKLDTDDVVKISDSYDHWILKNSEWYVVEMGMAK